MTYDPDLDEEQLERLKNSEVVKMAVACDEVADALEFIATDDDLRDRLVSRVTGSSSRIKSEKTAAELLDLVVAELQEHASMVRPVDADDEDDENGGA